MKSGCAPRREIAPKEREQRRVEWACSVCAPESSRSTRLRRLLVIPRFEILNCLQFVSSDGPIAHVVVTYVHRAVIYS